MATSFLAPILKNPEATWALRNARTGVALATSVEAAFDSASRNRGLLGRDAMPEGSALILAPCTSIHTFFMRFSIDVIFARRDGRVTKIARALPPWRLSGTLRGYAVVELPAGIIELSGTRAGDVLQLTPK